ncbi:MAG: hypothetical protein DME26_08780 [Verrucomicrobia bacterium]|nr:MAG: hypothetical protein DME26_08780 [Verrucomicrobiota bacterium]
MNHQALMVAAAKLKTEGHEANEAGQESRDETSSRQMERSRMAMGHLFASAKIIWVYRYFRGKD